MERTVGTIEPVGAPPITPPPRWAGRLVIAIMVAAFATGIVGTALAPTLVARHPLWLIALNANNRYLILATNQAGPVGFFAVATLRRVVPTIAFFLIGRWYGDRAVRWLAGREPASTDVVSVVERLFDRFGWWIVAVAPMTFTCLIAGARRFRPRVLVPLVIVSIMIRLALLRWLGSAFSGTLDSIVHWIDRSRGPLLVVTIGLVLFSAWSQRRRRAASFAELTAMEEQGSQPEHHTAD
ncbi:MAG: hypothetical protein JST73_12415 [Actinobacteria bacterium]|nr:hypothetical protein [Actinomycetota bacterium]